MDSRHDTNTGDYNNMAVLLNLKICINYDGVVGSLVMFITTILLTPVMIMIWRTRVILVSLYFSVFFVMEVVYVSAVFTKFAEGGWIPFAISYILAFIMFGWFYGRKRKIDYELTHKITFERLKELLADCIVQRVPGLCFFYTNIQDWLTPILGHYIENMESLQRSQYSRLFDICSSSRLLLMRGLSSGNQISKGTALTISSNSLAIEDEVSSLEEPWLVGVVHVRGKRDFILA
ncbi:hypothetical protein TSUD_83000 [Trifolium subterraneum]|uniref:K+ potassium transporter integral membrane domain-containing protein n=1 Tax=Trifolium subterraneum TaxID=3900 RepID=A0A2Z6LLL8_TRISU|nr:hypothetical protein TSUD_83000 [Trifolium subterraneum]